MGGFDRGEMSSAGVYIEPLSIRNVIASMASRVRADLAFAFIDVFAIVAAYTLGLAVRMLDPGVINARGFWSDLFIAMPFIVVIHIIANALAGAYGHVWEHASTDEATQVIAASAAASTVIILLGTLVRPQILIPYTAFVVGGLLAVSLMGMLRFRSRLFSFRKLTEGPRILVVGSGPEAASFARLAPEVEGGGRVVGFLGDRAQAEEGRRLAGLPILGDIDQIARIVGQQQIDQVVVVGRDPEQSRKVVDLCMDTEVRLKILPVAGDVLGGREALTDVRDIRVEDLLVRDPVATDLSAVHDLIKGKRVLVTGGGGSIGSEVVTQILEFDPDEVWVLDRDETLLHDAQLRWDRPTRIVLGDVRDAVGMLRTFNRVRPQIVVHAAALKHVPVLEAFPEEAALTNIVGTRNVIEAGSRTGMEHFVLISTDKAVDPTSVMGASKHVAELLVKAGSERNDGCVYTAVRFGNVLGSRGSVVPTFVAQVKAGGPVTVTDPEMTRYFMTVNEAVQLVLQASALSSGSEVFLLDMGEPVRIEDLARRLIRLAGLTPEIDIPIVYTGRRPGEKLTEVLATGPMSPTANPKIVEVALDPPPAHILVDIVTDLEEAASTGDGPRVIELLNGLVSGRLNNASLDLQPEDRLTSSWS